MSSQSIPAPVMVTVRALLEHGAVREELRLVAGAMGVDRGIDYPRIQKSGLALVGHMRGIVATRIQILGETETSFLATLPPEQRRTHVDAFFDLRLSCVIVTSGVEPSAELLDAAARTQTPLVITGARSSRTINAIHQLLDRLLAPSVTLHGVLCDVHGVGTLILGPSGIGKSECALFLVERGHRLVADDQVRLTLMPGGRVIGAPPPLLKHHLEIRGLGILNIRDLFGATVVADESPVDLVVELCPWRDGEPYERLGLDELHHDVLGARVPKLRVPVRAGRNMGVILEVAARNELLKRAGHHSAKRFAAALADQLGLAPRTPIPGSGEPKG